jgi:arginase family enzyme
MAIRFLNGPLDPDERESYIVRKIESCRDGYSKVPFKDPALGMAKELGLSQSIGHLDIEEWLTPTPSKDMIFMMTLENFITFIDSNGCLEYATLLKDRIKAEIFPEVPVTFGVDHSLSGGAIEAAADEYGGENLRLILMDSHFDFILPSIRCGLIQYDVETNPNTKFAATDPYIFNRSDSYNADSFLSFIAKKVPPENIFVVGVSDYPPKAAEEIFDERVKRYVEFYKEKEAAGVHVLRRGEANLPLKLKEMLSKKTAPFTYVSTDVDICANAALQGARFLDYNGLNSGEFSKVIQAIVDSAGSSKLVGFDFMEFDVYRAGATAKGKIDKTYYLMADAFRKMAAVINRQ